MIYTDKLSKNEIRTAKKNILLVFEALAEIPRASRNYDAYYRAAVEAYLTAIKDNVPVARIKEYLTDSLMSLHEKAAKANTPCLDKLDDQEKAAAADYYSMVYESLSGIPYPSEDYDRCYDTAVDIYLAGIKSRKPKGQVREELLAVASAYKRAEPATEGQRRHLKLSSFHPQTGCAAYRWCRCYHA